MDGPDVSLVTRLACDHLRTLGTKPAALLVAGAIPAPGGGLDLARLRSCAPQLDIRVVEDGTPAARTAARRAGVAQRAVGDLRTVPLRPRSCDLVYCCLLLHRIEHSELILDRLLTALRPGGLLIIRTADRDCSAGFLDRVLPIGVRQAGWRHRFPGQPGPFAAIYEPLASRAGIRSYATRRGLVVVRHETHSGPDAAHRRAGPLSARRLVAWLSHGRLTAAHDELTFVIRRPQEGSARLL
jgi:SAM-dependent methyltransferase